MSAVYRPPIEKATTRPGAWLSPRRRLYAQRLLDYVIWRGGKFVLDGAGYRDVGAECRLDRFQIDGAADDLYALGAIDMTLCGNAEPVLKALVRDMEQVRPAIQPARRLIGGRNV